MNRPDRSPADDKALSSAGERSVIPSTLAEEDPWSRKPRNSRTNLQEALRKTYVDILAVMELRWRGTGCMDLVDSEYRFFYAGPEDVKAPSETGFLVSKRMILLSKYSSGKLIAYRAWIYGSVNMLFDAYQAMRHLLHALVLKMTQQGVQGQLITLLRGIYADAQSKFKVGETTVPIKICRGVRQGNTISPKLFTATLEHVFRNLSWNDFGLAVNGNLFTNLRFADHVVLIAKSAEELQTMIDELDEHSLKYGLKISTAKTKIMATAGIAISLRGTQLECVKSFVYLGQISLDHDFSEEMVRRIRAGWNCFHRFDKFLTSRTVEMKYKRALFNMCILPAMLYGAETWVLSRSAERKLACAQRRMERFMVGVRLLDKKTNEWLRGVTKVKDAVNSARERKWTYGWELAMSTNVKWLRELVEWRPPITRPTGRPKARWRDEFQKVLGTCNWQLIARAKTKKEWVDLTRCHIL
ncbi:hypothetical protein Y032_0338g2934 [Ancylostoma ceylanicum]|nr:hypothetical protein Y032_0338g2934 [Ancylostoma ceylanicum]